MKRDLTLWRHSQLEFERNCQLADQRHYRPESQYYLLCAKRVARLDAEILRRVESHIEWLREQLAEYVRNGWVGADHYVARIAEIQATQRVREGESRSAELQAEPMLRLIEFVRCYGDEPPLLADMMDGLRRAA